MSIRCLVTGAAGFIGSHLSAALLARGWRVLGLDNFDPFYTSAIKRRNIARIEDAGGDFRFVRVDLRSAQALTDLMRDTTPDVVFHCAALAGVRSSVAAPGRYADVNIGGTLNLLDAMNTCGCPPLVLLSSSSVYGAAAALPFCEHDPCAAPSSPYAATKRASELLARSWSMLDADRRVCILRLFSVYGPSQRPDLAVHSFMRALAGNKPIRVFGDGRTSRDYTYIDDIIRGVLAAADRLIESQDEPCDLFNLGSGRSVALNDLIDCLGFIVGCEPVIVHDPAAAGDMTHTHADLSRAASELGYVPQTSLMAGLETQWQWYIQQRPDTFSRSAACLSNSAVSR